MSDRTANDDARSSVRLAMAAHAVVHTYELSLPILVAIWRPEFGVSALLVGVVLSAAYGLFGLGAPLGGVLADRYGPRTLIVVSLSGMSLAFLGLSVAPGFGVVALSLLVWGTAASVYHPAGLSLISTSVRERGSAFAYHGVAGNLGTAVGPLATALLLVALDWRLVAVVLAVPALAAAAYAARLDAAAVGGERDERGGAPSRTVSSLPSFVATSRAVFSGAFVAVFAMVLLYGLYYRGMLAFLPELVGAFDAFAPVEVGGRLVNPERYFYAGLLAVGVLGQYVGGRLADRVSTVAGLGGTFVGLAVLAPLFVLAATAGVVPVLALGALLGFTLFLAQPFYQAAVAEHTPAGARGLSYGYTYVGVFGVGALGGALAGALITYASSALLFLVLAGLAAAAAVAAAAFEHARRTTPRATAAGTNVPD